MIFKETLLLKDDKQIQNIINASRFTNEWFNIAILDIENWFADDKKVKHYDITTQYDTIFAKERTLKVIEVVKSKHNFDLNRDLIDIGFSPLIQSGGNYDFRITAESDTELLKWDLIRLVFCYK